MLLLVCDDCQEYFYGECDVHGNIRPIGDSIANPSDCLKRAMQTLPKGMVIKRSHIRNAGLGVFATESFTDGATFGPYEGEKLKANIPRVGLDTSYMWEVSVIKQTLYA